MKTNYLVIVDTGKGRMFAKSYRCQNEKAAEELADNMRSMNSEWTVKIK